MTTSSSSFAESSSGSPRYLCSLCRRCVQFSPPISPQSIRSARVIGSPLSAVDSSGTAPAFISACSISDSAGFQIRSFIRSIVKQGEVLNAVTPDILGKERRKAKASKEGKLGVEGMSPEVLLNALRRAGATIDGAAARETEPISMADMYHAGLTGKPDSAMRRERLLSGMELPKKMTAAALLPVLNALMSREEFLRHNY